MLLQSRIKLKNEGGLMHYIGIDYHKKYSYIVVKDRDGVVEQRGMVSNKREEVQKFVEPYRTGKAVLESSRNWGVIYDWLEEILDDIALAHPLKVRAIAEARIKTDKISADILCDLLRSNLLPEAYVPSRETRETKNVLRQRIFFVRLQTMVKNRIHTIIDRHPEIVSQAPDVTDMFGATGIRWLSQVVLPGQDNRLLASAVELLQAVRQKISESNEIVTELARDDRKVRLLRSIPGLGPFFSVVAANEIDDISRFDDEKKLCACAGLVPSTYASGGKVFHGRITKVGNKWLRWAFIEAVPPAIKHDADLFAYYQRLRMKKGNNAAKVATARRLLTIAYRVLRHKRLYERRNRTPTRFAPAALSFI
jgi:transposase